MFDEILDILTDILTSLLTTNSAFLGSDYFLSLEFQSVLWNVMFIITVYCIRETSFRADFRGKERHYVRITYKIRDQRNN